MSYHQTTITLPTYARGIHVITPVSPLMKMLTQM